MSPDTAAALNALVDAVMYQRTLTEQIRRERVELKWLNGLSEAHKSKTIREQDGELHRQRLAVDKAAEKFVAQWHKHEVLF